MEGIYKQKPRVANLGILLFYKALEAQNCDCTQIEWTPPYKQPEEIEELLDEFLLSVAYGREDNAKGGSRRWTSGKELRRPTNRPWRAS